MISPFAQSFLIFAASIGTFATEWIWSDLGYLDIRRRRGLTWLISAHCINLALNFTPMLAPISSSPLSKSRPVKHILDCYISPAASCPGSGNMEYIVRLVQGSAPLRMDVLKQNRRATNSLNSWGICCTRESGWGIYCDTPASELRHLLDHHHGSLRTISSEKHPFVCNFGGASHNLPLIPI